MMSYVHCCQTASDHTSLLLEVGNKSGSRSRSGTEQSTQSSISQSSKTSDYWPRTVFLQTPSCHHAPYTLHCTHILPSIALVILSQVRMSHISLVSLGITSQVRISHSCLSGVTEMKMRMSQVRMSHFSGINGHQVRDENITCLASLVIMSQVQISHTSQVSLVTESQVRM